MVIAGQEQARTDPRAADAIILKKTDTTGRYSLSTFTNSGGARYAERLWRSSARPQRGDDRTFHSLVTSHDEFYEIRTVCVTSVLGTQTKYCLR